MGFHRLFGLFLMLAMANRASASSDLVCGKHAGERHAVQESAAEMDHHGGTSEKMPCHHPAQPDCCSPATSCTSSLSLAAGFTILELSSVRAETPRSSDDQPLTRLIPPDPPPPKVQASHN